MPLPPDALFGTQSAVMTLVSAVAARRYLVPWLLSRPLPDALFPLLLYHATRVVGLGFLSPSVTGAPLPDALSVAPAVGDLAAAVLALLACAALHYRMRGALALVWAMNIVGLADLVNAIVQGVRLHFPTYPLGPMWFVPTFLGPTMIVTHVLMIWLLLRRPGRAGDREPA